MPKKIKTVDMSAEPIQINECCKYDAVMSVSEVKKHFDPKNSNKHSPDSIRRMGKVLKYQGWNYPILISNNTGVLNQGHKRTLGAELEGQTWIPVSFRTFKDQDQETSSSISDNATGQESELDLSIVNELVLDFDPATLEDPEILGIADFEPVAEDKFSINEKELDENLETKNECPSCGYEW